MCRNHLDQNSERTSQSIKDPKVKRRMYDANKRRYERRKAEGLCVICGQPSSGGVRCSDCKKKYKTK